MGFEKFGAVSYVAQTKVADFVKRLESGKVYGTKCLQCGYLEFPPRAFCGRCLSNKWDWVELSGNCKLITFTKVHAAPTAFQGEAPYTLGLAEFSEGPKVLAWVDKAIPESEIKKDISLRLRPISLKEGQWSYVLTKPIL